MCVRTHWATFMSNTSTDLLEPATRTRSGAVTSQGSDYIKMKSYNEIVLMLPHASQSHLSCGATGPVISNTEWLTN